VLALRRAGMRPEAVADGETALDRAREDTPDVVVIDLHLPGIDGLDTCARLGASCAARTVLVSGKQGHGRVTASSTRAS
jgi:DNA-binding response OmpR family regulator